MTPTTAELRYRIGDWTADRDTGELIGAAGSVRLEPKVMDLLMLLASRPGEVFTREQIMAALWPGVIVGEDTLARTIFKLRQALGDDSKQPRYVETLSRRGYRLLAAVGPVAQATDSPAEAPAEPASAPAALPAGRGRLWMLAALALSLMGLLAAGWIGQRPGSGSEPIVDPTDERRLLLARADDYYFQFSRADNEAAIELYQRVLGQHPDDSVALSGLANALVQRCIRWPELPSQPGRPPREFTRLSQALDNGHLALEPALGQLRRARQLAERAVELAPDSAAAHKALGFVSSAGRHFDQALASYRKALSLDADAWGSMINIGDVLDISGRSDESLPYYEQAYAAMGRVYDRNPVQVRPWYASLGVLIAERHQARGELSLAETWYRRVLSQSPLHPAATRGLAGLLRTAGDPVSADRLCKELLQRVGAKEACR